LAVGSWQLAVILKKLPLFLKQFFISMDGVYADNCLEQFQRISMGGVYAENRLERFQCAFN
jgi:hypothetical protein